MTDRSESALCIRLEGGHVIDPSSGVDAVMDMVIAGGTVAVIGPEADRVPAARRIDVRGLYVTPGLVDLHTHLYSTTGIQDAWAGERAIPPDAFSFRSGTTTMIDAGSAGWKNFYHFRATVLERSRTRLFAFLNIAGHGMLSESIEQDPAELDAAACATAAARHRDCIVGIKAAHYRNPDWMSVDRAILAGEKAGLPVMVDFGYFLKERPYWELVGSKLRKGDISTHCFRGTVPTADADGALYGYLRDARNRGVLFDVGHGGGSLVFRTAVPAMAAGFYPDSISTDIHTISMNSAMMDLPTTMSKFLAMGMPLMNVIEATTTNPAAMIGHPELGRLSVGTPADIAVWNLLHGRFGFGDTAGGRIEGGQRLFCEMTFKCGEIMWDWSARGATDYRKLGTRTGIREGIEDLYDPEKPGK